jgi:hypothetical protein
MHTLAASTLSLLLSMAPGSASAMPATTQATAATAPAPKPTPKQSPAQPVTIVGCVQGNGTPDSPYTLADAKDGTAYRLTGKSLRGFGGKRVQVVGGPDSRRITFVGGLVPSANVAAQAGAMDPARAAVASDPLSTSTKDEPALPELRVKSVRTVTGDCEK